MVNLYLQEINHGHFSPILENFKGPLTFVLPTFWSKSLVDNPHLEGQFFDARPSNQNVGFGVEHAYSPALISYDNSGKAYSKVSRRSFPKMLIQIIRY